MAAHPDKESALHDRIQQSDRTDGEDLGQDDRLSRKIAILMIAGALALVGLVGYFWSDRTPAPTAQPGDETVEETAPPLVDEGEPETTGARILFGMVVDVDGDPIDGAAIASPNHPNVMGVTAEDGRYKLTGVTLDALLLVVSAQGYEPSRVEVVDGEAGDRAEIDVELAAAEAVVGIVLDPDGEPVVGAVISCTDRPGDVLLGDTSDADGNFALASNADGCMAIARHRELADSDVTEIGADADNKLYMNEPASIAGFVVDAHGAPIAAYTVAIETFRPAENAGVLGKRGHSQRVDDDGGRFVIEGLQAGSYVLTVSAPGRPPAQSETVFVDVGERSRGTRITCPLGALLSGRVTDVEGEPIAGATVTLDAQTMTRANSVKPSLTDDEGHYELDGVPRGPFSIRVSKMGYNSRVVPAIETGGREEIERDVELQNGAGSGKSEYEGIGAMLANTNDGITVAYVVKGGPAEEAGLLMKDVIVRIDGRDARELTVPQAVQKLRGVADTTVALTIVRGAEEMRLVITRRRFTN